MFWWDTQAEKSKGAPEERRRSSATALTAESLGTDRNTIQRWRKKLNDPGAFEATYANAIATRRPGKLVIASSSLPAHVLTDRVVQRLLDAEKALSVAVGIDQVKLLMDVAAAQEVFAKRQDLGEVVIGFAHALKVHALAKLGDLLASMPKATGRSGPGRGKAGTEAGPAFTNAPTLAELGIDKKTSAVAQQLAALPAETRDCRRRLAWAQPTPARRGVCN